jgi:thiol-disulfide isomerase/thioredoxin
LLPSTFHTSPIGEQYMSEDIEPDSPHFTMPTEEFSLFTPVEAREGTATPVDTPVSGELSSLAVATTWLNSQPLSAAELRGKVVLVEFWTYTCVNWLRTLPYVRAWSEKYKEHGLVVIGVHAPEFPFEHDVENVRRAARAMNIEYPIAIDNKFEIWSAFANHYWPALYLLDSDGQLRHHHFGEGDYLRMEVMIQQLLAEVGKNDFDQDVVAVDAQGAEAAADWDSLKSPESYLGYERTDNFSSPGGAIPGERFLYATPDSLKLNHWALSGDWTVEDGKTRLNQPGGRIVYRFHARDLHLVMGPPRYGDSLRYNVRIDGMPPGSAHGTDIDKWGNGTSSEQRLHQLIRQSKPITDREFDIEFLDPGVEAFVFTFG